MVSLLQYVVLVFLMQFLAWKVIITHVIVEKRMRQKGVQGQVVWLYHDASIAAATVSKKIRSNRVVKNLICSCSHY